jgi:hypothetical protein
VSVVKFVQIKIQNVKNAEKKSKYNGFI